MGHQAGSSPKRRKLYIPSLRRLRVEQPARFIRESMRELYDNRPLNEEGGSGVMKTSHWFTESNIFVEASADAFAVRRSKAQSETGAHLLSVQRFVRGVHRGRLGDLSIDRDPGTVYLMDMSSRVEGIQRAATMQNIFFHKNELGFDPDRHPQFMAFPTASVLGRLIYELYSKLFDRLHQTNELDLDAFDQLVACLKLAMGTDSSHCGLREKARTALFESICCHIERNIGDPDFTVDTILQNFGVSRASLYRLFEDRGGVRQYISDRRLLHAVLDITARPLRRGDISAAAEKWGFSSNANFNRAVRREFGVTPGALIDVPASENVALKRTDTLVDLSWGSIQVQHGMRKPAPLRFTAPLPTQATQS